MSDVAQGPGWWQASDGKWYPPQGGQQQYPQAQQQYPTAPQKNKRSGCLTAFLILAGLGVVAIVIVVIAAVAGGKKVADTVHASEKAASSTCQGFSYPDKQKLDHCAQPGGEVQDFGLSVTAGGLKRTSGPFGNEICSDVTYFNRATTTKSFNTFDWKLQTPSGKVQSFELSDATLHSGDLVTGGRTNGSVCFDDPGGETGQFVLIWKPEALRSDRGIWVSNL